MMAVTGALKEETANTVQSEEEDEEDEYDEHVWTSPLNAQKIVKAVSDALCKSDSENAQYYRSNTENYLGKLRNLDSQFRTLCEKNKNKYIVVADRFPFLYLANEYSINYYAAFPGCSAQTEANPVTIAFLCNKIKSEKVPVVFKTDLSAGNVAYSVSEQTGAKVMTLYSCHTLSADDFKNGETYVSLMQRNLSALTAAFSA